MPRSYTPGNADKHLIEAALTEAGYPAQEFGTVAWVETEKDAPPRRFVKLSRVRGGRPIGRQYESPGNEWVTLALVDLDAMEFGPK